MGTTGWGKVPSLGIRTWDDDGIAGIATGEQFTEVGAGCDGAIIGGGATVGGIDANTVSEEPGELEGVATIGVCGGASFLYGAVPHRSTNAATSRLEYDVGEAGMPDMPHAGLSKADCMCVRVYEGTKRVYMHGHNETRQSQHTNM
jgi:hypothetical protein